MKHLALAWTVGTALLGLAATAGAAHFRIGENETKAASIQARVDAGQTAFHQMNVEVQLVKDGQKRVEESQQRMERKLDRLLERR